MKKLFGIPIHINYDRIPEEEYVDHVRQRVNTPKRKAVFHICIGTVILVCAILLTCMSFSLLADFGLSLGKGFSIGVMLGIMAGCMFLFSSFCLYMGTSALRGNRIEKLLLEYYEQTRKKD